MRGLKIFYLRLCFLLFINAEFSNAVRLDISDRDTFAYTALIHTFFVRRPHEKYFTRHPSSGQMFLGLHKNWYTLSFYEMDAVYSYFSFKQRHVDFEIFHAKTMVFTVKDDAGVWHFRCVFSADENTLDTLYSYLSLCTGQGFLNYRSDIIKVQQYIRMGRLHEPIIRNVEGLEPALLYDQEIERGNQDKKVFCITPGSALYMEHKKSRLVFRTGNFRVKRLEDVVVLNFSGFSNWFYILYFEDAGRAHNLVNCVTNFGMDQDVALDIPADLLSFIETGMSPADAPPGPDWPFVSRQDQPTPHTLSFHALHTPEQPSASHQDQQTPHSLPTHASNAPQQPSASHRQQHVSLTLPPSWSGKQPRSNRRFARNVLARSDEELD